MIAFWSVVVALTVVALVFLVVPLVRKPKTEDMGLARAEFDLTVYKDQLVEVDRDLDRGVLTEDQALAARTEIERRMLAVAAEKDTDADIAVTQHPKASLMLMVAILVAIPLGAVGFYLYLGQPSLKDQPLAQREQPGDNDTRARAMELLTQLEQRLKENPKDIDGWWMQAQVYGALERHTDAATAYQKVVDLTNRDPGVLTAWAEALIVAENNVVIPAVVEVLNEIKTKDPSEPRSYFYLAQERRQRDDLEGAMGEYIQLLKASPSDAEWVGQVQDLVKSLAGEMEVNMPVVQMLPPASTTSGPTAEQMQDAQQMSPEEQQAMIQAMVQQLADRLKDNPDDLAGWQRLAQVYRVMGEMDKAAEADAQVKRLQGQ